jgi:excisionase family DNA binding protein
MGGKMSGDKLTYSVEEAARVLGISRNLAYGMVHTGALPVLKLGKRLLVPKRALEKLLEEPKGTPVWKRD